jgi:hypothetical protein
MHGGTRGCHSRLSEAVSRRHIRLCPAYVHSLLTANVQSSHLTAPSILEPFSPPSTSVETRSNSCTLYHNHTTLNRKWEDIWPYRNSTTFLVVRKVSASTRQRYTPGAASSPASLSPFHCTLWAPASLRPSRSLRMSRPSTS